MTYNNFVKYISINRIETFTFSPYLILLEFRNLLSSLIFNSNIVIHISSIRICSPYNRTQLETWLYYQGFDWNVTFENMHKIIYDQTVLRS